MSEETAEKAAAQKPSERIGFACGVMAKEAAAEMRKAIESSFGKMSDDAWSQMLTQPHVENQINARLVGEFTIIGIIEELDREAVRRTVWEKRVEAFARDYGVEL